MKIAGYKAAIDSLVPAVDRLSTLRSALDEQLGDFVKDFTKWKQSRPPTERPVTQSERTAQRNAESGRTGTALAVARARQTDVGRSANGSLPAGERSILIACAQHEPRGCNREQISILTGYKRSTRNAYIQRLSEKEYVECRGEQVIATQDGINALGHDYQPLPTGEALRDYWIGRLPEGERKVLQVAIDTYPEPAPREVIGGETGYKRSTRNAYIQRLSTRRLVVSFGDGIKASDELFS